MNRRGVLEDPSVRLVRADVAEAWARHLYVMQNLPGYTSSVRRAIPGEGDDGQAAYVEYWRAGWRLWQATQRAGPIAELGLPGPVPRGFEMTRGLRMYRVRERSMVLRVNGAGRIVSFTGGDLPQAGHWLRRAGMQGVLAVPNAGAIVDWTTTAARRLRAGKQTARGNRRRHALAPGSRKSGGAAALMPPNPAYDSGNRGERAVCGRKDVLFSAAGTLTFLAVTPPASRCPCEFRPRGNRRSWSRRAAGPQSRRFPFCSQNRTPFRVSLRQERPGKHRGCRQLPPAAPARHRARDLTAALAQDGARPAPHGLVTAKPAPGCAVCAPPAWPAGHQQLATPARRAAPR
jgi:hypothetical protein